MSSLINAGEGIDVDVFLRRENRSKTIDKVAQRIRLNRTKLKSMQDTSTDYEELAGSIQAGYFIKQGIANYNEDLFYMSVFVTVSARTYEELMWRKQQMTDMLKSIGRLDEDVWEDQQTHEKKSAMVIILDDIEYASGGGKSKDNQNTDEAQGHPAASTASAAAAPANNGGGFTGYESFGGGNSFFDEN